MAAQRYSVFLQPLAGREILLFFLLEGSKKPEHFFILLVHSTILEGKDFIIPARHFRILFPSTPIFGSEKNENEEGDDREVGVLEIDDEYSLQG
jgi:hypothetical protein